MPKGKPKAKYANLYEDKDPDMMRQRKTAPQAAPHRRGGTHRVKDEDLTGTHWDHKNYQELIIAAKDANIWTKDMPKVKMAKALAQKDRDDAIALKMAEREAEEKRKELAKQKERQRKEKEGKRLVRERRRAAGEDVSDTTESEVEEQPGDDNVGFGEIMTDEDAWDSTATSTTTNASISPIFPARRLRIFQWPYPDMPSPNPPRSPMSPSGRQREDVFEELLPRKLSYAVMTVVTTMSGETLELPGRVFPEEIGPDFVPMLSEHIKDCARNGVLIGPLRKAVVECAADWAQRTQVQWWNGRMYFHLPPRKTKTTLADVYTKWKGKKAVRHRPQRDEKGKITKAESKKIRQQKEKDKREKVLDIYTASEYRPPICYIPSYLDYPSLEDDIEVPHTLDNLYFIRFPGMDLPHYYFWTMPDEWEDPTVPNPEWLEADAELEDEEDDEQRQIRRSELLEYIRNGLQAETNGHVPQEDHRVRVKKSTVPRKFKPSYSPPKTSKYKAAVWSIERDLYQDGWSKTMYKYREKWIGDGKEDQWKRLMINLPILCPSGKLPDAPPVHPNPYTTQSLAEKFAAIEAPSAQRLVEPIKGEEAWTRDDDAYWDIVDAPMEVSEEDIQEELLRALETPMETTALHRRVSDLLPWLHTLSPSYVPPPPPAEPESPLPGPATRVAEREEWEERFLRNIDPDMAPHRKRRTSSRSAQAGSIPKLVPQTEQMPVAELKYNLYALMNERRMSEYKICLDALENGDAEGARRHYEQHRQDADQTCPFCSMPWAGMDSQMKASHIFSHDMEESSYHRRRASERSSTKYPLYSVPKTKRRSSLRLAQQEEGDEQAEPRPRRMSKVSFAPFTVEKRVAYNDLDGASMDADISSIATTSSRRSSLRKATTSTKKSRKSNLKIDTSSKVLKPTKARKGKGKKTNHVAPDLSCHDDSTPSSHFTSPGLHLPKRYPDEHPDATWNPRKHSTSSSDHVPSPYLPTVKKYPVGHPDARYDPRKASKSSTESLELYRGRTRRRTKNTNTNGAVERKQSTAVLPKGKGKGKVRAKVDEEEYKDVSSSASSYAPPKAPKRRGKKPQDPTYRDVPPPSPSSGSRSPVLTKRRRASDPTYRDQPEPSSASSVEERPTKKRKTKAPRIKLGETPKVLQTLAPVGQGSYTHHSSTVSNASSGSSDRRRKNAVKNVGLDVIELLHEGKKTKAGPRRAAVKRRESVSSCGSQVSPRSKRRKVSVSEPKAGGQASTASRRAGTAALNRRSSTQEGDDFIAFINEPLAEDYDEDVLTGNPFAAPKKSKASQNKTGNASKAKKPPAKSAKLSKTKTKTPKEVALETKKSVTSADLANRRAAKAGKKLSILGRPVVEPLIIAPAKQLSKRMAKAKLSEAAAASSSSSLDAELFMPPTPNSRTLSPNTPKKPGTPNSANSGRDRRSWAPTPSPSLTSSMHRVSASSASTTKSKAKTSPLPIDTNAAKRKASYDVPYSDTRPIVPPNTPAEHLGKECEDESEAGELDVEQLADKMGKVKTTRGGLVREIPGAVVTKGKARGASVSKKAMGKQKAEGKVAKVTKRAPGGKKARVTPAPEKEERPAAPKRKRKSEVELLLSEIPGSAPSPKRLKLSTTGSTTATASMARRTSTRIANAEKKARM